MESALKEEYFEAVVPDTLDLAERAALAINALTRAADAKFKYETPRGAHLDHQPAFMSWRNGGLVMQRPIRALPKMRVMSGSTLNSDVDARMSVVSEQPVGSLSQVSAAGGNSALEACIRTDVCVIGGGSGGIGPLWLPPGLAHK